MKKGHRRQTVTPAFVVKAVLWLMTAALLGTVIFLYSRGIYSMLPVWGCAVMAAVSAAVSLWLDAKAGRQEKE